MDFSEDNETLVSGWVDHVARIWDVASGREIQRFTVSKPFKDGDYHVGAASVVFSPSDKYVLTGSIDYWRWNTPPMMTYEDYCDNEAHLFEVRSGREVQTFHGRGRLLCPTFSPDGKRAAIVDENNLVIIWDIRTGQELRRFKSIDGEPMSLGFSPNGRQLALGNYGLTVIDVDTGKAILHHGTHWVTSSVAFSPDGSLIAVADVGGVWLWNWKNQQLDRTIESGVQQGITFSRAIFSPDGRFLLTLETHKLATPIFSVVRVVNLGTGEEMACKRFMGAAAGGLAVSPNGSWVAVSVDDGCGIHLLRWSACSGPEACQG